MSLICRTCMSEIASKHYIDLKRFPFAKKQLLLCVPELDFDIVLDQVICMTCAKAMNAAYKYKRCCLQTEQRIRDYLQILKMQSANLETVALVGNTTDLVKMHDVITYFNAPDNHFKPSLNLENVKEEYPSDATYENCDNVEWIYEGIKEDTIKIEETKLDNFIKIEAFDSCTDAGVSFSLEQWSEFENGTRKMQDIMSEEQVEDMKIELENQLEVAAMQSEGNDAEISGTGFEDVILKESRSCVNLEKHNQNLEINNAKFSGLISEVFKRDCLWNQAHPDHHNRFVLEKQWEEIAAALHTASLLGQYSKSDYENCIANRENCSSSVIYAESSTKQNNHVVETPETVDRVESKDSFSSAMQNRKISARKITDTSNNNSLKKISKHKSTTKGRFKNARPGFYRLPRNKKNMKEQIVTTSVVHSDLFQDCRVNLANCKVMNNMETEDSKFNKCGTSDLNVNVENIDISHIGEKPFRCNSSDYPSSEKVHLRAHMADHTGENPYKCNSCDYACLQKSNLKSHMVVHTQEKLFKCNFCDYASCWKSSLKIHMNSHTREKIFKCNSCDYACLQKSNLKSHMLVHTQEKLFKCNFCDYASCWKSSLKVHMNSHTREKTFKCNSCDYACLQKNHFKAHMAKHTGEKPFKCNSCEYACLQKSHLKAHMAKHTGEKPFKCNSCDYTCLQKSHLKSHMLVHTQEKLFKCNFCHYASCWKSSLKVHMNSHTREKTFKCNCCDYVSSERSSLTIHMRTGEKPNKCNSAEKP